MRVGLKVALAVLVLAGTAATAWLRYHGTPETVFEIPSIEVSGVPLCPWRHPRQDLTNFFEHATDWRTTTRILSGRRNELEARLGRKPTGDENSVQVHEVLCGEAVVGYVIVRRVKGTHGAIEVVVLTDEAVRLRGLRLQRLREPAEVAAILDNPDLWRAWIGRTSMDFAGASSLADVPSEALASVAAVQEGVRSGLILLEHSVTARTVEHRH